MTPTSGQRYGWFSGFRAAQERSPQAIITPTKVTYWSHKEIYVQNHGFHVAFAASFY
jgi:hypothetical protein